MIEKLQILTFKATVGWQNSFFAIRCFFFFLFFFIAYHLGLIKLIEGLELCDLQPPPPPPPALTYSSKYRSFKSFQYRSFLSFSIKPLFIFLSNLTSSYIYLSFSDPEYWILEGVSGPTALHWLLVFSSLVLCLILGFLGLWSKFGVF